MSDAYLEMAGRYGCAVVLTRAREPRDNAAAEKAVGLCETWVLAPLADERFPTLPELSSEAGRLVGLLNARPCRCWRGSHTGGLAYGAVG